MLRAVINGRALGNPNNGIPQFVQEIITHLDQMADDSMEIEVVVPQSIEYKRRYKNISVVPLADSHAWDYLQAERYARSKKAIYINLSNNGCLYRNSIATFHDIRVLRDKSEKKTWRSIKTRCKFAISYALAIRRAGQLTTVSNFSRSEIAAFSKIDEKRIEVVGSGWDHLLEFQEDQSIFQEYPQIKKGEYYFSIGSIAPHKNFQWVIQNAKYNPIAQYIIVGKTNPRLWSDTTGDFTGNVLYLGYQSSERIKALFSSARALVFPSFYEGFGLPPLEALACGIPVIVSDIPVMHEILGACANYIQPNDANVDLEQLLIEKRADPNEILKQYTWSHVTARYLEIMKRMATTK